MSVLGDTLTTVKRLMLLDADVQSLKAHTDKADAQFLDHERRLTRIETLIEIAQRRLPRD